MKFMEPKISGDPSSPVRVTTSNGFYTQDPSDIDEAFVKLIFPQIVDTLKRKYVVWAPTEAGWLRMRDEAEKMPPLSLRRGVAETLRKSFAGRFIRYMNKTESTNFEITEKKFEIMEFMLRINDRPTVNTRLNDFTENIKKYVHLTVENSRAKNGWISQKMFIGNLPTLRLVYRNITNMDTSLKRYRNLLALILTANYLQDFVGSVLPPNLNLLELYGNVMNDLEKLLIDPPLLILYFGAGRNFLWKTATLERLQQFQYLYFLDLSDNNFENLQEVLDHIRLLSTLRCISLEGNPCSVPVSYVHILQRMCPQIEFLDGIRFIRDAPTDPMLDNNYGVMHIHGIRFFHVPKPNSQQSKENDKVARFYQLEFELPLLDANLIKYEAAVIRRSQTGEAEPKEEQSVKRTINSFRETSISEGKNKKETPILESLDRESTEEEKTVESMKRSYVRWLMRDKELPTPTSFMSPKVKWADVMDFLSPSIEIPVEPERWRLLRDTMRSVVVIRLYYKETMLMKSKNGSTTRVSGKSDHRASRRSSKRRSSGGQGRKKQSIKRQSSRKGGYRQSVNRESIKRKLTIPRSSKSRRPTDEGYEKVLLVRDLIAKIPVPAEIPKWNVPFMGYTWDMKDRCLAKKYPGIEKVKYAGEGTSRQIKRGKSNVEGRKSVLKQRKSQASSVKLKKHSGAKRQSEMTQRQSQIGSKRRSRSSDGVKKKIVDGRSIKRKKSLATVARTDKVAPPSILSCHVGIGLKRLGKEAPSNAPRSRKSKASRQSKTSKLSRKSKSSRKSRRASRKSLKRQSFKQPSVDREK